MLQRMYDCLKSISLLNSCIVVALLVFYGSFLSHPVNLVTADLGRHLKNGELFFKESNFIRTNTYAYTQPDFPVVTHHWATGALFYAIFRGAGWAGLELFFVALSLATFLIAFFIARKEAGWGIAAFTAIPLILLISERTEIRPEAFSYFFAVLFFFILFEARCERRYPRWLWALPLIEVLWVNTHIFFILGPAIIAAFALEALIAPALRARWFKTLCMVLTATAAATLVNPFGVTGVVEPFTILGDYGYRLVENQSVWFIQKLMPSASLTLFKFLFGALVLSFIFFFAARRRQAENKPADLRLAFLFLALGFSLMAWLQIRNFALFGFFALPIIASNIAAAFRSKIESHAHDLRVCAAGLVGLVFLVTISGGLASFYPKWNGFHFGLEKGNAAATEFFRATGLRGPIFNNYDIGGYLIYHLYPAERVFVDNRPEAYSVAFFEEQYVPMQEREDRWQEALKQYQFNVIFFYWHDATPWAQQFLIARVNDAEWVPVFVDDRVLILVRNVETNSDVIKKHAISKERFIQNK